MLGKAPRVFTTVVGAKRLGGRTEGLAPWQTVTLAKDGRSIRITATPARHGPAGIGPFAGDVVGFVLSLDKADAIYITGDTVWYDGVAEVARRHKPGVILLFAGAAQTRGPFHLTMDTNDAIEAAQAFPEAVIVPVHYEGWMHFKQSGDDLLKSFNALGFGPRPAATGRRDQDRSATAGGLVPLKHHASEPAGEQRHQCGCEAIK